MHTLNNLSLLPLRMLTTLQSEFDALTTATEYAEYSYEFTAVDIDNYITLTGETLPDWLSLEDLAVRLKLMQRVS